MEPRQAFPVSVTSLWMQGMGDEHISIYSQELMLATDVSKDWRIIRRRTRASFNREQLSERTWNKYVYMWSTSLCYELLWQPGSTPMQCYILFAQFGSHCLFLFHVGLFCCHTIASTQKLLKASTYVHQELQTPQPQNAFFAVTLNISSTMCTNTLFC